MLHWGRAASALSSRTSASICSSCCSHAGRPPLTIFAMRSQSVRHLGGKLHGEEGRGSQTSQPHLETDFARAYYQMWDHGLNSVQTDPWKELWETVGCFSILCTVMLAFVSATDAPLGAEKSEKQKDACNQCQADAATALVERSPRMIDAQDIEENLSESIEFGFGESLEDVGGCLAVPIELTDPPEEA
mmetsp:Transcript_55529/g.104441  ORF Transcript_55529/g.104441 Transcript_55529/m.104441 type:complete len:189 (+) Transcript_55529:50-616(+)